MHTYYFYIPTLLLVLSENDFNYIFSSARRMDIHWLSAWRQQTHFLGHSPTRTTIVLLTF